MPGAAALREVEEESGLTGVRHVEARRRRCLPVPSTHARVPLPLVDHPAAGPGDNHLPERHMHIDHQYVAGGG